MSSLAQIRREFDTNRLREWMQQGIHNHFTDKVDLKDEKWSVRVHLVTPRSIAELLAVYQRYSAIRGLAINFPDRCYRSQKDALKLFTYIGGAACMGFTSLSWKTLEMMHNILGPWHNAWLFGVSPLINSYLPLIATVDQQDRSITVAAMYNAMYLRSKRISDSHCPADYFGAELVRDSSLSMIPVAAYGSKDKRRTAPVIVQVGDSELI
ncbi:hypothetical protein FQR65_LT17918 [Abscondita terminalis]|nr:hypothetical protein FQR65_LT17918 [Abscondita terminalis]